VLLAAARAVPIGAFGCDFSGWYNHGGTILGKLSKLLPSDVIF